MFFQATQERNFNEQHRTAFKFVLVVSFKKCFDYFSPATVSQSNHFQRNRQRLERSSDVSASELSYLTAQVWTLENRLKEETRSTLNLTVTRLPKIFLLRFTKLCSFKESYQSVANEKYELLQELTCQKQLCQQMYDDLQHERLTFNSLFAYKST